MSNKAKLRKPYTPFNYCQNLSLKRYPIYNFIKSYSKYTAAFSLSYCLFSYFKRRKRKDLPSEEKPTELPKVKLNSMDKMDKIDKYFTKEEANEKIL